MNTNMINDKIAIIDIYKYNNIEYIMKITFMVIFILKRDRSVPGWDFRRPSPGFSEH